eukprot:sb/3477067/
MSQFGSLIPSSHETSVIACRRYRSATAPSGLGVGKPRHSEYIQYVVVERRKLEREREERLDHARAKIARHPKFRLLSLLCFASNHKITLKFFVDLDRSFGKLEGHFLLELK